MGFVLAELRRLGILLSLARHQAGKKLEVGRIYTERAGTSDSLGLMHQSDFSWQNWHTTNKVALEIEAEHSYFSTNYRLC